MSGRAAHTLKITAIHEAGHAVAAHYLRIKIKHVTIVPKEDSRGHVLRHAVQFARDGVFDDSLRGIDRAERHILALFAGQVAQRKFAPGSKWRVGGSEDVEQAMELFFHMDSYDDRARNLQMALLWRKTELLVVMRWKDVQAVADALLERKALTAAEVREVIDRAHGLEPFVFEGGSKKKEAGK